MLVSILLAAATAEAQLPSFLAGCWEYRREGDRWTEECWTGPRGDLMLGSGRDGKGNTVSHWEWMRIELAADGALTFYASPKGATSVPFKAIETDANSVTFVSHENDFPQRVRYVRTATGLEAEISLLDGSRPVRWSYRRSGAAKSDQPTISSGLKK